MFFGCFEPKEFDSQIKGKTGTDATHGLSQPDISFVVGICTACSFGRVSRDLKAKDEAAIRYPAFLLYVANKKGNVSFRVWVFGGENKKL